MSSLGSRPFLYVALLFSIYLAGCENSGDKPYIEKPVGDLYLQAFKSLKQKDYRDAAGNFDEIERQHPYSSWASKAQLLSAYASFRADEYAQAIGTLDTFITLHPSHEALDYALYLRALCYYHDIPSPKKDDGNVHLALQAFNDLIARFPTSSYARDARFKKDYVIDHLAAKEMDVGHFYQSDRKAIAALNRFEKVVKRYERTRYVPEALYRIVELSTTLGLKAKAKEAAVYLGHNFSSSPWYTKARQLIQKKDS
eukprot:g8349.t1